MQAKEKAFILIKITFERMANATNYKGVEHDGGKKFGIIEDLSKNIAYDFVDEMIKQFKNSDATNHLSKYWQEVREEIKKM